MDIQSLLKLVVEKNGSDLHIRAGSPPFVRVDGKLYGVSQPPLSPADVETILKSYVSPHAKAAYDAKGECDFSFEIPSLGRFRTNAYRERRRLCLAIRRIAGVPRIDDLRLPAEALRKIAQERRGLVLLTGATGSGKSSTLAAMVDYINETRSEHVVTVEDPIEFVHKDKKSIISQREIGEDTVSYADGLRMALRQDPNVILVGEMRDLETTEAAMTAALTGHLVLSTLHTTDAVQTISRIVDLYPPHQQALVRMDLGQCLKAVVSQRLLPSIKGGRVPAVEIVAVTAHVRKLIEDNNSLGIMQACAKGEFYGMQTFNQSLVKLCRSGLVSEADALDAATSPDDLRLALRGIEQQPQAAG